MNYYVKTVESGCKMRKKTVAVVFGGASPEYNISLMSAYSIINAINREEYEIVLIGITKQGVWYRFTGDVEDIQEDKWHTRKECLRDAIISPSRGGGLIEIKNAIAVSVPIDVVFPVLHGRYGEDGTVQGLCELAGIPLVGSGCAASALCMDKDRAHKLVSLSGIRVPKSICFESVPTDIETMTAIDELGFPVFVKPVKAGSSFGISKVEEKQALLQAIKAAFYYDDAVLLEESIDGFETGCSVVGNDELIIGRVDEIELSGDFFDFDEKYSLKTSKIHMPARIDSQTEQYIKDAAKTIYRVLGCKGYARIDIFLTGKGEIVFNEANTIPGFTSHSRFPNMIKGIGIDYPALIKLLIELGIGSIKT